MTRREDEVKDIDIYDKRHLQTKTLERWELQKQIWEKTRMSLITQTARGKRKKGNARIFTSSNSYARAKEEDLNMIEASVPRMAMSNRFGWESLLRCADPTQASRYVRIGKGYYPYPLYVEIRDPASEKKNDFATARIAFEESEPTLGHSLNAYSAVRELVKHKQDDGNKLKSTQGSEAKKKKTLDEELELFLQAGGGSSGEMDPLLFISSNRTEATTYHELLQTHKRAIQKRFAHFFQPRCFMKIEGTPAPLVAVDAKGLASTGGTETNENPVQYFPPPQRLRLGTPNPNSPSFKSVSGPLVKPNDNSARLVDAATAPSTSISGKPPGPKPEKGPLDSTSEMKTEGFAREAGPSNRDVALEISTKRVLILARPGKLTHAHITITNRSTVTFFYSWVVADLLMESITAKDAEQVMKVSGKTKVREKKSDERSAEDEDEDEDEGEVNNWRVLHALAKRSASAQPNFFLSNSPDGVILPGESSIFSFSVRISQPGRFQRTYELLTVPTSDPNRILVEITVLVDGGVELRAEYLARPVAEAMEAKVVVDSHRHLVQQIVRNCEPYEAADLEDSIYALTCVKDKKASEEKALLQRQRESWEQHNGLTFDGIPYNKAVFDMLGRVWENLQHTLKELNRGNPEPVGDENKDRKAAREDEGASRFLAGPSPDSSILQGRSSEGEAMVSWESTGGSLAALLHEVARVRDAPSRNIFYNCVMVLLRAARVSQDEQDPLCELLHHAAEALVDQINLSRLHSYIRDELHQLQRPVIAATKTGSSGANHPSSATRSGKKSAALAATPNNEVSASRGKLLPSCLVPVQAPLYEHLLPPEDSDDGFDLREILFGAEGMVLVDIFKKRLKAERPARVKEFEQQFFRTIECGARLPLLGVVQKHRIDNILTIQQSELITVDTTTDVPPLKPVSTTVKGKFKQ